jgi:hypothetical protein
MWVLETEGDALQGKASQNRWCEDTLTLFEGKKLWLRPGKKFIFGRTKSEGMWYCSSDWFILTVLF